MRSPFVTEAIKIIIGAGLIAGAYFFVDYSQFYSLFIPNIFLFLGLAMLTEGIFSLFISISKKLLKRKKDIIGITRATFIILFLVDIVIRLTGVMRTYSEKTDGNYFSRAEQEKLNSWYWLHTPNTSINNKKKEFRFQREVNSMGLSEKEIEKKSKSKIRILAIGDSFTEGVGVNYEDTWVKNMETRWKVKDVQTINAGIGGSDPVYQFALYRDKLVDYNPNIVILTLNATDISDIAGRGGFDRFHADGTAGKNAPTWEWIYACNHFFRLIMHGAFNYNSGLIKNADSEEIRKKSVAIIKETILKFNHLTKSKKSKLLVVIQPSLQDFKDGYHTPFFGQNQIIQFLKDKKISYVDSSLAFKKKGNSIVEYYYPIDAHFNQKGYNLFGKTIYEKIERLGMLN